MDVVTALLALITAVLGTITAWLSLRAVRGAAPAKVRVAQSATSPRRRRVYAALLAAASVTCIGLYFLIVASRDDDEAVKAAAEDTLRTFVPSAILKTCDTHSAESGDVIASVRCEMPDDRITLVYDLFADEAALRRRVKQRASALGLPEGICSKDKAASGTYSLGGEHGAGALLCYSPQGSEVREWTVRKLRIYVTATQTGKGKRTLASAWTSAFPYPHYNRRPFPDEREALVLRRIPKAIRKTCERNDFSLQEGSIDVTIECSPGRPVDRVYYALFFEADRMWKYYRAQVRAIDEAKGCEDEEYTYSDDYAGRWFCYIDSGRAVVEWANDDLRIYAWAHGETANLKRLRSWWEDAGPTPDDASADGDR